MQPPISAAPASPCVLEAPKVVALGFDQKVGQVFGEASRYGLATAQAAGNLKLGNGDILAESRFPAHGACRSLPSSVIV
jgi:hypothetical protein